MFDVVRFLKTEMIEYIETGPNVAVDHVNIRCPFCRDDPSFHMGVNLRTGQWGCWRNGRHRGNDVIYLVKALRRCSEAEALAIVKGADLPDGFDTLLQELLQDAKAPNWEPTYIHMDPSLQSIDRKCGRCYWLYLRERGFEEVDQLVEQYDLRFARSGRWSGRVVIPIRYGEVCGLLGWTGRAISKSASIKYLSHPDKGVKQVLYNVNDLYSGGRYLYVCEGPFDALKVDFHLKKLGSRATCMFGRTATKHQLGMLWGLCRHYEKVRFLLDDDAMSAAMELQTQTACFHNTEIMFLPTGTHDPGEMTPEQVSALAI